LVTLEKNLKENISSGTLLAFKKPSFLLPPAEPPNECLKNAVLNFYQSKKTFPLNVEDVNSFAFIIWTFLPFFTYTKASPVIFSFRSENFVFDPGILTIQYVRLQSTIKLEQFLAEDKLNSLEQPLHVASVLAPRQVLPQESLEHFVADDMIQELKTMFSQQVEQELLQTVKAFQCGSKNRVNMLAHMF
ncbi:hypothetical protein Tco_1159863, partial [Tanacetum coccineum]